MTSNPSFQLFTSLRYDPLLLSLPTNTSHWPSCPVPKSGSPFYMLPHHRDRILQAAEHFGWSTAASKIRGPAGFAHFLKTLEESIGIPSSTPLRVKVLLSHEGEIAVETQPTPAVGKFNLFPARLPPPKGEEGAKVSVSPLTGGALELGDEDSVYGDPERGQPWDVLPDTLKITPSPYTSYKTTSRDMYMQARERVGIKDFAEKREVLIVSGKGEVMEGSLTSVFFWREGDGLRRGWRVVGRWERRGSGHWRAVCVKRGW